MSTQDTICALSTAAGRAGIAVVRMSGPRSFELLQRVFVLEREAFPPPPRCATLGRIVDVRDGMEVDQALATCFPCPNSYTGDDVVELSVHGSPVIVAATLDLLCSLGARLAEPGEFTMRGFLNGRMDLAQAEAVRDVVAATTLYQARVAARQRSGELSRALEPLKRLLIEVIVNLESAVEFVEEDLPVDTRAAVAGKLEELRARLGEYIDSYRRGRIIRDGFSLAIVGRPNAGKSSLFNALLARERSIVTEIPGTTRDVVSEYASIEGIPVRLSDTAGVRGSDDPVERIGVERSLRAIADADATLLVVDTSRPPSAEDEFLKRQLGDSPSILVMNKCDLDCLWPETEREAFAGGGGSVRVSARFGTNVAELRAGIVRNLLGGPQNDGVVVTSLRHCRCLESARDSLTRAAAALRAGMSEEFPLADLHTALRQLGEVTGETTVEDLLGEIFSKFCIGK